MSINITVKCSNDTKYTVPIETTKTVLEFKEAIAAQSDTPADKQRLIYSGRVLKDSDTLDTYKIQDGHTVHMVKYGGAAASSAASASAPRTSASTDSPSANPTTTAIPATTPSALPNLFALGTGANMDPWGANPFAGLGTNPYGGGGGGGGGSGGADPTGMMGQMLDNPLFAQYMAAMLQNPQVLDSILSSNPQFAAMGPEFRAYMQSPEFRTMLSDPNLIRSMIAMNSAMGGVGGMGTGFGGLGAGAGNPYNPWGATSTAPLPGAAPSTATQTSNATTTPPINSSATTNTTGASPTPPNPFAALLNPTGQNSQGGQGLPSFSPFMDPYMMQQMAAAFGGSQPATSQQQPEVRFQVQLQQLQEMGFHDGAANIRALLASGGNVQAAVDYLFQHPM